VCRHNQVLIITDAKNVGISGTTAATLWCVRQLETPSLGARMTPRSRRCFSDGGKGRSQRRKLTDIVLLQLQLSFSFCFVQLSLLPVMQTCCVHTSLLLMMKAGMKSTSKTLNWLMHTHHSNTN
jgi:hypothetical protein